MPQFSTDDLTELKSDFNKLAEVCYPPMDYINARISFTKAEDFAPGEGLEYGFSFANEIIAPNELKDLSWRKRSDLLEHGIDEINADGQKWYYNIHDIGGTFWSEDGQKKVSVVFGVLPVSATSFIFVARQAVKQLLSKCKDKFIDLSEAEKCFPEEVCRRVYDDQPPVELLLTRLFAVIEHTRQRLANRLVKDMHTQILNEPTFKRFLKQNPDFATSAPKEQVMQFLRKNKPAIFVLGEKYGYIKNAARILRYHGPRDETRHPKKGKEDEFPYVKPRALCEDFRKALKLPNEPIVPTKDFGDLLDIGWAAMKSIRELGKISDVVSTYADSTKKRSQPDYWAPLEDKEIATSDEIDDMQSWILAGNTVAHGHKSTDNAQEELMDSYFDISDLAQQIKERHDRRFERWLKDHCYDPYSH